MYRGIDVSDHQGVIQWDKVKMTGVQFAILRSVRGSGKTDYQFSNNAFGCRDAGIPFDIYKYSYADTMAKARKEAEEVVKLLKQQEIVCTVWWDVEDDSLRELGRDMLTTLIHVAQTVIEAAQLPFGIYCNQDWYRNVLEAEEFDCPFWIARYPSDKHLTLIEVPEGNYRPKVAHELFGWQYSSKGRVLGIKGNVDLNLIYAEIEKTNSATSTMRQEQSQPLGSRTKYPEPTYTLYRGRLRQSSLYVRWLQQALGIKEDGIFGKNTERELRKYQFNHKLRVDGKCGQKTVASLK
ncbi:MAG: GH25 family lysozyme [Lachnospiraceae bacterium]